MRKVVINWHYSDACLLQELYMCLGNVRKSTIALTRTWVFNNIPAKWLRENSNNWSTSMLDLFGSCNVLIDLVGRFLFRSFDP